MEISPLILIACALGIAIAAWVIAKANSELEFQKRLKEARADATKRSRAVIGGQFSEQLAPFLPDFPFKPTEVKFLGKPTDFLAFPGLDNKNIEEVVFVEVKSGKASLSKSERSLQKAVENGNVRFVTYRVPEEVTDGKA